MIEMTPTAKAELDKYFETNAKESIRIYVQAGCGGGRLALGLDKASDGDEVVDVDGYEFVVEKALYEDAKPLALDFTPMGFNISSSLKFEQSGGTGSCGSCCGGCG